MTCSIDDCVLPHYGRGMCSKHYQRWRKYGSPHITKTAPKGEALTWLENAISYELDECLIWPFGRSDNGYGAVFFHGRKQYAHRVMCFLAHGEPPSNRHEAAHSCGNGAGGCCNQNHLRWATPAENNADKIEHGTNNKGERHGAAKLKEADILAIRAMRGAVTNRNLALCFGVSHQTISDIQNKKRWSWVKGELPADQAREYLQGLVR